MKQQKESQKLRAERIAGTGNGSTLRTRVVRDRTKYTRKIKFKKSVADAADFAFAPVKPYNRSSRNSSLSYISGVPFHGNYDTKPKTRLYCIPMAEHDSRLDISGSTCDGLATYGVNRTIRIPYL